MLHGSRPIWFWFGSRDAFQFPQSDGLNLDGRKAQVRDNLLAEVEEAGDAAKGREKGGTGGYVLIWVKKKKKERETAVLEGVKINVTGMVGVERDARWWIWSKDRSKGASEIW